MSVGDGKDGKLKAPRSVGNSTCVSFDLPEDGASTGFSRGRSVHYATPMGASAATHQSFVTLDVNKAYVPEPKTPPRASKQQRRMSVLVDQRLDAEEGALREQRSLVLDKKTGKPIFRSPRAKKKYGWADTPKRSKKAAKKTKLRIKKVLASLPAPPSVSKYRPVMPPPSPHPRGEDKENMSHATESINWAGNASQEGDSVAPGPPPSPAFLTRVPSALFDSTNATRAPPPPQLTRQSSLPDARKGRGSAVAAVREKRVQRQKDAEQARLDKIAARAKRRSDLGRARHLLAGVECAAVGHLLLRGLVRARAARERLARRRRAQLVLACWYRRNALYARLQTMAQLARTRCLALTIRIRIWRKRYARKRIRTFVKETNWSIRIRAARVSYLRKVRVLQALVRAHQACTAARLEVLRRLWNAVEEDVEAEFAQDQKRFAEEAALAREAFEHEIAEEPSTSSVTIDSKASERERRLAWKRRKKDLEQKAKEKRRRRERDKQVAKSDVFWNKVDGKMEQLKKRIAFVDALDRHGGPSAARPRARRAAVAGPAATALFRAIPFVARETAIADFLKQLRDDHGNRWGSRTLLQRYRCGAKRYNVGEVRTLLEIEDASKQAKALPPTDRAIRMWPILAFYLPWRGDYTLHVKHWSRATLKDQVRFLYSCTRD